MPKRFNPKLVGRYGGRRKPQRERPPVLPVARSEPAPTGPVFDWRTFDPSMIPDDGDYSFAEELTTYRDHLDELLEHEGLYVVIKKQEIIGVFAERGRALDAAVERFGNEPTLVKKIVAEEPIAVLGHAMP